MRSCDARRFPGGTAMRVHSSEQLSPSSAWTIVQQFLRSHGRTPAGEPLSAALVEVLMVGAWVGCRFALLDRELALAVAALGNAHADRAFDSLRQGFAADYGDQLREAVQDELYARGFTHAWARLVD